MPRSAFSVALRKESVDRNKSQPGYFFAQNSSLSARRAWIEINKSRTFVLENLVALRKESVDRNVHVDGEVNDVLRASLSARRAWIEINLLV